MSDRGAVRHAVAWRLGVWCLPLLSVAACARGDRGTTLTVTNWADWTEIRLEQQYIGGFSAGRPGVRVSLESVPNQAEYRDLILTSIAAGTPPDVFLLDNIDVPAFVGSGTLLDLAPYAARVGTPWKPSTRRCWRSSGAATPCTPSPRATPRW